MHTQNSKDIYLVAISPTGLNITLNIEELLKINKNNVKEFKKALTIVFVYTLKKHK